MSHRAHLAEPKPSCGRCRAGFREAILVWGREHARSFPWRRTGRGDYELVIAEVLLQQTRAEKVAETIGSVLELCPTWHDLARVPEAELAEVLRPLGLFRRRAQSLRAMANAVCEHGLPREAKALEQLPGLGQYIARAIAVQLAGERVAPIDTNVARIIERVFGPRRLADLRYDPCLQELALDLVPQDDPASYLLGLLDFGAMVCRTRAPRCEDCPVKSCRFRGLAAVPELQR